MTNSNQYGEWIRGDKIGEGGNGGVYQALHKNNGEFAIKILKDNSTKKRQRFIDEFTVIKKYQDEIKGIVPIVDSCPLESKNKNEDLWYVMPRCKKSTDVLSKSSIKEIIFAIHSVAITISSMHKKGVAHRDIKPDNLLFYKDQFCVSDWGLVDFPGKVDVSGSKEAIGPKFYMPPEMRRNPQSSDAQKADCYMLAKTLWALLTKKYESFDGEYRKESENNLEGYIDGRTHYLQPIHDLLEKATLGNPNERPSVSQFANSLGFWLSVFSELDKYQVSELNWSSQYKQLPLIAMPDRMMWKSADSIIRVINSLTNSSQFTHMFYPDSGGDHFLRASLASEANCIDLETQSGSHYIVKPNYLLAEFIYDDWSYLRLVFNPLRKRTSHINNGIISYEELWSLGNGFYIPEENVIDKKKDIPSTAKFVYRYFRPGSIVIFTEHSTYNKIDEYVGVHNMMSDDEFRNFIIELSKSRVADVPPENRRDIIKNLLPRQALKKYKSWLKL